MTADGFRVKAFVPYGRLAQSMAFFSAPGMERLYSGVTNSTASTAAMASLNAVATGGIVRVVVVAIERQVLERDLRHVQL